jgi:cytoskeleton protein RodZ
MFVEKTSSDNSQKLKIKRDSLGLSLEDVFKKIRIRSSYLQDIENSEFHLLPAPVYTKNFIKTYAKFLGVDEEPILKDYDDYINAQKEELMPPQETPPEEKQFFASVANKKNYFGVFFVLIIVFMVWLILKQNASVPDEINSSGKINVPAAETKKQNANSFSNATSLVNQQTTVGSVSNVNETGKETPANVLGQSANSGQKNTLFIIASQETWIRVKAEENPPFQVLLKPGDKIERNEETFNLDIGNAGGIKIQYKGKYIENVGKSGEVIHLRLP